MLFWHNHGDIVFQNLTPGRIICIIRISYHYNFANPQAPAPEDFTYANWQQAWQQVAALAQNERQALLLDEFTYLLEIDPSIAGQLQKEKTPALGECKWGPEPSGRSVLTELVEKTAEVVPSQDQWQVFLSGLCPGRLDRRQPRVRPGSRQRPPDRQELACARHASAGFGSS